MGGVMCVHQMFFFLSPPPFHHLDKTHVPSQWQRPVPTGRVGTHSPGRQNSPRGTQPQPLLRRFAAGQTLHLVPVTATAPKVLCQG